jgi:hypothetical protein
MMCKYNFFFVFTPENSCIAAAWLFLCSPLAHLLVQRAQALPVGFQVMIIYSVGSSLYI